MAFKLNPVLAHSELAKAASLCRKHLLLAAYKAWKQAAVRRKTLQSTQDALAFLHHQRLRLAFICWKEAAVATRYQVGLDSAV